MIFLSIIIFIVAIALPSINNKISSNIYIRLSSIILIYSGLLALNAINIPSMGSGIGLFSGLFHVTLISQLTDTFIFLMGSLILIAWPLINNKKYNFTIISKSLQNKFNKLNIYPIEYSLIILFSTLGASLLVSSADLISMYLSIELQSFGLYILSTIFRDSNTATSAGLKYFLLGSLSSCLILLGAGLIYSFTGLTNFESIYSLIAVTGINNINQGVNLGIIFIFVGLLFKIAAAPLHNWAPDVYNDSPTIVTIWLTIMPKISILILLLELYLHFLGLELSLISIENINKIELINNLNINYLYSINEINSIKFLIKEWGKSFTEIKNLLLLSSFLSLILGTIVGLAQTQIKRLLAYSTISHIGFILLALSISTEQSIESFIFYIIQYSITNLNTFLILIALSYLIYNSILQRTFLNLIKNNYYFYLITKILDTIKYNILNLNLFKLENLNILFPVNIYRTKNTLLINWIKLIKKELIQTDIKYISELKGQFFLNPLISLSLSICLFSMAGIPPLIGFFSKQFVLYSAVQSGYYFISIIAILTSVISASYYLKIIKVLHEITLTNSIKKLNYTQNLFFSISDLRQKLLEIYANINKTNSNNQVCPHKNYFKEIQLIFILNFIFKFYFISQNNLNTNSTNIRTTDFYTEKEFWQINKKNFQPFGQFYLNKTNNEIKNKNLNITTNFDLEKTNNFFYQLTNFHSFLISNLTIIILLFVLKPSILLSSTRLLSLSIFTY